MKKIVQRTCIGCNEKKDKKELIRIVRNKEGKVQIDKTGKMQGRGAYICLKIECLDKAIKTKRFERALEVKPGQEIYDNLRGVIIGDAK